MNKRNRLWNSKDNDKLKIYYYELNKENIDFIINKYADIISNIIAFTGISTTKITIYIYDNIQDFCGDIYPYISKPEDYTNVYINHENKTIYTILGDNLSLYLLYVIYGKWKNVHHEWFDMINCWAELGFPKSCKIDVRDNLYIHHLLHTDEEIYKSAKAFFFASMTEKFGFQKMVEWLETPDLIYYYKYVFGSDIHNYKNNKITKDSLLYYPQQAIKGNIKVYGNMKYALWIDEKFKKDCILEVIYDSPTIAKAAIKYHESVLGFLHVKLIDDAKININSYVTNYLAWERRRAAGYARNNPYNEQDFMNKVIALSQYKDPKILEIGIGSGRVAKPFIEKGCTYYGIDISPKMLDECMQHFGNMPNLHIIQKDVRYGIPLEDNSIDIILESRVFSSPDPFYLSECARVLKHDGIILRDINDTSENIKEHELYKTKCIRSILPYYPIMQHTIQGHAYTRAIFRIFGLL